jgi:predicted dithiol-disulfide oxidoreductase (DUF899 family)
MSDRAESVHAVRFPNETPEYRAARDELLGAEIDLRRQMEAVAAGRRKLPLGGEVPEDYVFVDASVDGRPEGREVRLSELFAPAKGSLVVYNLMFNPVPRGERMVGQPCSNCTSLLDALNGEAPHLMDRINLAVVAKSPAGPIRAFARERGWRHLPLFSSAGNSYNRDYQGETADGTQMPALNVFTRRDGRAYHTYATELLFAPPDRGQWWRHVDLIWPLWNVFDYTPEGRPESWVPRLSYGSMT